MDETYERVLKEIGLANRDHVHRLLQCLTVAIRPLRVEELAEILALDFDVAEGMTPKLNTDWRWKGRQRAVLSACSSLITLVVDGDSRVIQFSHFSVKEFLTSDRLSTSTGGVSHFHITPEPAHTTLVRLLLDRGANVDSEDKERLTPLHLTASDGYTGIVRLLLNHDADRDAEDKEGWTPLHLASSDGHAITVRLLLNRGARLKNKKGRTPLQVASTQGMGNVVEILIEHGAEEYEGL